jgi:hypothetical protein
MCRADLRWRDGLADLAVIYYGETQPAARLSLKYSMVLVDAQGIEPWTSPV